MRKLAVGILAVGLFAGIVTACVPPRQSETVAIVLDTADPLVGGCGGPSTARYTMSYQTTETNVAGALTWTLCDERSGYHHGTHYLDPNESRQIDDALTPKAGDNQDQCRRDIPNVSLRWVGSGEMPPEYSNPSACGLARLLEVMSQLAVEK